MIEQLSPGRALAVLLLAAIGASTCGEDDLATNRQRPQPGAPVPDGGIGGDAVASLCPPAEPKVGENCPSTEENQLRCTFNVGVCEWQGSSYDITLDYCCQRGVVWETCGTNTTPCDRETAADAGSSSD